MQLKIIIKNIDILQKLIKIAFKSINQNVIKFNNFKFELIHFDKLKKLLIIIITLLNNIIL